MLDRNSSDFDKIIAEIWPIAEESEIKGKVGVMTFRGKGRQYVFHQNEKLATEKWIDFQTRIVAKWKPIIEQYWLRVSGKKISVEIEFSDMIISREDVDAMKTSSDPIKTLGIRHLLRREMERYI